MIYCSVKYCCSKSSIPGVILHSIREEWLNLVDWKRPNPNIICNEHFPSYIKWMGKSCQSLLLPQFLTLSELFRTAPWKLFWTNIIIPYSKAKGNVWRKHEKREKIPKSELFPQSSKKKTRRKNSQSRICDCRNKRQVLFTRDINLLHSSASKILEELFQRVIKKVKILGLER